MEGVGGPKNARHYTKMGVSFFRFFCFSKILFFLIKSIRKKKNCGRINPTIGISHKALGVVNLTEIFDTDFAVDLFEFFYASLPSAFRPSFLKNNSPLSLYSQPPSHRKG